MDDYILYIFKAHWRATGEVRPNLAVFGRKLP